MFHNKRAMYLFVVSMLVLSVCHGAPTVRSREYSVVESDIELRVVANTEGSGRIKILVSMKNAGETTRYFFPTEAKGVPTSLAVRDDQGRPIPYTTEGEKLLVQAQGAMQPLKPGETVERTFVVDDLFVFGHNATTLTLCASRWLVDEQHHWIRIELLVPDLRNTVVKDPFLVGPDKDSD